MAGSEKWIGDRLLPARRERPVAFELPPIEDAASALLASRTILPANASITPQ
jgi:hypothetical protein